MAITKTSNSGLTGIKYNDIAADNNYMETIASTLVGAGGSSTIVFNNIPQGYKHLQIRCLARTDRGYYLDYAKVTFNSDTGANYTTHHLFGDGATAYGYGATAFNATQILRFAGTASPSISNAFGAAVVDILDYANTNKNTTIKNLGGIDFNGSGELGLYSGLWNNTSAINNINIAVGGGTLFSQYSRFSLYGIKG